MYILECESNKLYVGSTRDLNRRLSDHFNGLGGVYTHKYKPIRLVYFEAFESIELAFNREQQIKNWSRKKKEALITQNYDALCKLAKCQNTSYLSRFQPRDRPSKRSIEVPEPSRGTVQQSVRFSS
jgi:putative endonuclease